MTRPVRRWFCLFLAGSLLTVLVGAACGSEPVQLPADEAQGQGRVVFVTSTPGPRPTLWPTFTPHPTPVTEVFVTVTPAAAGSAPVLSPTATVGLSGAGASTPRAEKRGRVRVASVPTAMPDGRVVADDGVATPEPGVGLGEEPDADVVVVDGEVREVPRGQRVPLGGGMGFITVRLQALFPYQYESAPRFLTHGDVGWPAGVDFISRGSRYVYWAIEFDDSEAADGWSKSFFFRWVDDVVFAETGRVMLEAPTEAREGANTIYLGVGRPAPGFWRPGRYTVSLLDSGFEEILSHSFDVR